MSSAYERQIVALFCANRDCHDCPFSRWFHPDRFPRKENTDGCAHACGDTLKERLLCWSLENSKNDPLLQRAIKLRGFDEQYIESILDWCGCQEGIDWL